MAETGEDAGARGETSGSPPGGAGRAVQEPVTLESQKAALDAKMKARPVEPENERPIIDPLPPKAKTAPILVGYGIAGASAVIVGVGSAALLTATGISFNPWVPPVGAIAFLIMTVGLARSTLGVGQ